MMSKCQRQQIAEANLAARSAKNPQKDICSKSAKTHSSKSVKAKFLKIKSAKEGGKAEQESHSYYCDFSGDHDSKSVKAYHKSNKEEGSTEHHDPRRHLPIDARDF